MDIKIIKLISKNLFVWLVWSIIPGQSFHSHGGRLSLSEASSNTSSITPIPSSDPADPSNSTLSHIKLGLAAAFFFGVLIFCGLPVILINYLQHRGSPDNDDNNDLYEGVPNEPVENTATNHTGPTTHTVDLTYTNFQYSKDYNHSGSNLGSSWRHPSITHRMSTDSEQQLCSPTQSPNPALLGPDHLEQRDLLTGELVTTDHHAWTNPLRLPERLRTHNPSSTDLMREKRKAATNQRRLKRQLKHPSATRCSRSGGRTELLQLWFSRCNCFAAGVFLSSGFMELLPDVEEAFHEAKTHLKIKSEFPFASFFSLIGLFLVLSIEQIVWTCKSHEWPCCVRHSRSLNHVNSFSSCDQNSSSLDNGDGCGSRPPESRASPEGPRFDGSQTDSISLELSPGPESQPKPPSPPTLPDQLPLEHRESFNHQLPGSSSDRFVLDQPNSPESWHSKHQHGHSHLPTVDDIASLGSIMRLILLLSAMSVHSMFEGLAVGLQPTSQRTIALFSAILLHKLIIAAGIGVNLATNLSSSQVSSDHGSGTGICHPGPIKKTLYYQFFAILLLASASPIGVLIGWTLIERQQSGFLLMSTAVLQALACGTFFYVVFCELLPVEFREGSKNRIGKLVFLIAGFLVVALYAYLMPE